MRLSSSKSAADSRCDGLSKKMREPLEGRRRDPTRMQLRANRGATSLSTL